MTQTKGRIAIASLRLVLGIVVLVQAFVFLYGSGSARSLEHHDLPNGVRLVLGWSEIGAAILFLFPRTVVTGSWFLLVVLAGAILLHIAHGEFGIGGLVVYVAGVVAVLANHEPRSGQTDAGLV
jgi:uncharacterized membrane protein YphA (DoxX/SURF4 family)